MISGGLILASTSPARRALMARLGLPFSVAAPNVDEGAIAAASPEETAQLREQLARERVRVMDHLLPRRSTLRGNVQVFPVAVEIRFQREGAR